MSWIMFQCLICIPMFIRWFCSSFELLVPIKISRWPPQQFLTYDPLGRWISYLVMYNTHFFTLRNNAPIQTATGAVVAVIVWYICSWIYNYLCNQCLSPLKLFPVHGEVYSIHHYAITFVSDLTQVLEINKIFL
jgi:uncharacterized BrkB/YihY/UPF0761 family membrane protein